MCEHTSVSKTLPKYDAGYKAVCSVKEEFLHFLKKYVKADWAKDLTVKDIRPCPNELILPDYRQRLPDLAYEIHRDDRWLCCYLIVQLQSSVDYTMIFRFASELQGILLKAFLQEEENIRERKDYRIPAAVPILLYNGRRKWTGIQQFRAYQRDGEIYGEYVQNFAYHLVDISQISDTDILSSNYLIDNIIYLDKHRYDMEFVLEKLSVVTERIRGLSPEKAAMFWDWMEHVFTEAIHEKYRPGVKKLIEKAKQGGNIMFKYAITDMIEQSMAQSKNDGWNLGLTEGRMLETIENIVRNLDKGLSSSSIAYWLNKDPGFVEKVEQIHKDHPEADTQTLAEYCKNFTPTFKKTV